MNEHNAFPAVRFVVSKPHHVANLLHAPPTETMEFPRPLSEEGLQQWYEENRLAGAAYVRVLTNSLAARYGAWVDSKGQVRALEPVTNDDTARLEELAVAVKRNQKMSSSASG